MCVESEDKKAKCRTHEDRETSTEEAHTVYKRIQTKIPPGDGYFVCVCCTGRTKGDSQDNPDKKQVRMKYKERTRK